MMYGLQKGSGLKEVFVKTIDKNIVTHYRAAAEEIHIDVLERMIAGLQRKIAAAPKIIEKYPPGVSDKVKRAIDMWNADIGDINEYEVALTKLEAILEKAMAAESLSKIWQ